jgi:ParB/RepB/Spo0J family partition protein
MAVPTWRPSEIIINNKVKDDPITLHFLSQCPGVPVKYVDSSDAETVKAASTVINEASQEMLPLIMAGKRVVHISPASAGNIDEFEMPDPRLMCPEFDRLKFASNGCYYNCDWCFLKATYRANQNFINIHVQYDETKKRLLNHIKKSARPVMYDSGELADSLAMEHLTKAGQEFIPWFGKQDNGYLYMLTKSANVDSLLKLEHNKHTIIAWSINAPFVSTIYEVGAPSFRERINAAKKVQEAGYPIRIRLDPIIPILKWKHYYSGTIKTIFEELKPERITLGTLRLEEQLYNMRDSIFSNPKLKDIVGSMTPMLEESTLADGKKSVGKYSFSEEQRIELFQYAIDEIKKYSECDIALCKETKEVWDTVGLDLKECKCVCQYDSADMTKAREVITVTTKKKKKAVKTKTKATKTAKAPEITFADKPAESVEYESRALYHLQVQNLNPDPLQPRRSIDTAELKELAASIKKHGVLQPILFRKDKDGNLIIVSGERRFQASKESGEETIPAMFINDNPSEIALIENLLRVDLTSIEEAEGLLRLKTEQKYNNKQLGAVFGKAESTISEILKLNQLPQKLRDKYRTDKQLSKRGLLEVTKAADDKELEKLFKKLVKKELNRGDARTDRKVVTRGADTVCRTMGSSLLKVLPQLDLEAVTGQKLTEVTKVLTETLESLAAKLGYTLTKD